MAAINIDEAKVLCVVNRSITPTGAAKATLFPACVVVGNSVVSFEKPDFEVFLDRIRTMFYLKKTAKVEGTFYEIGDFVIKAGTLFLGPPAKCPVIEVRYKGCPNLSFTIEMIKELVSGVVMGSYCLSCFIFRLSCSFY